MHTEWTMTPLATAHMQDGGWSRWDMLGFLEPMLDPNNPAPAAEQFDENYQHGGGWRSFQGFTYDAVTNTLRYDGDPPMRAIAETRLRDERVILFEGSWVAIIQPDGALNVSRMD